MEASVVPASVRQHRPARATARRRLRDPAHHRHPRHLQRYWIYKTMEEIGRHVGEGLGGVLSLVIWILVSPGDGLRDPVGGREDVRQGRPGAARDRLDRPLALPFGHLPIIPAIVWFVKIQRALNRYWEGQGRNGRLMTKRPAQERRAGEPVAPRKLGCARDPHARAGDDVDGLLRRLQLERRAVEGEAVVRTGDPERLAQAARARAETAILVQARALRASCRDPPGARARARARPRGSLRSRTRG